MPCDPTDLIYFRKQVGEDGVRLIFEVSVAMHGDDAKEREITVDTTVQEKNVTFPTDLKLLSKIIEGCRKIAAREGIRLRRSYRRVLPKLRMNRMKMGKKAKKMRRMAGALIRELHRKLPKKALERHQNQLDLYERVKGQKRTDKNKIYSLHELDIFCLCKGKTSSTSSDARRPLRSRKARAS